MQVNAEDSKQNWYLIDSFWGAVKRHSLFAALCCLPLLILVVFTISRWSPEYSSTATIVFDVSKMKETQTESSLTLGNRVTSAFYSKLTEPDFLLRLYDRLESKGIKRPEYKESTVKTVLKAILPESLQPKPWTQPVDPNNPNYRIEDLLRRLTPTVTPAQFSMSVTATAESPKDAQTFAREAIDLFVEEELLKLKSQLQEKLEVLTALESSTLLEKADPKEIAMTQAFVREEGVEATDQEKKELKRKEQDLIAKILLKQKEAVRAQAIQYEREFQLQNELNALLSKRSPAHPEVIQKKEELQKFRADMGISQVESMITAMKGQLFQMQSEMRAKGIPIDRSVQLNSFSDEVRRYLLDVSNQIRALELEIQGIEPQLQDPSKWVRYNLVRAAELPNKSSNLDKLFLAVVVGVALVGLCFILIVFIRELSYPWIVEARTLHWKYQHPVLVNVPSTTFLDVEKVRTLRARLGDLHKKSDKNLRLLDSYRFLQQLMKKEGDPQVICFYDIAQGKVSRHAALNLANVMATDSHERVIFLSFNPANQKYLPKGEGGNLMSFLAGEIDWKTVRVKANDEIACDLAVAEQPEFQLGHFREDLVHRLIKALREKYQRVIIDGLDPVFMSENAMLAKEADVILIGATLGQTRHKDLERVLSLLPDDKVQGFVLG